MAAARVAGVRLAGRYRAARRAEGQERDDPGAEAVELPHVAGIGEVVGQGIGIPQRRPQIQEPAMISRLHVRGAACATAMAAATMPPPADTAKAARQP